MIRLDKVCTWTLIVCLAGMVWSGWLVKWIDELACYTLLAAGLLDCVVNRRWRAYRPLLVLLAVMTGYVTYTLAFKSYNTLPYVLMDAIIELKPFVPLIVVLAVRPRLTPGERVVLKAVVVANSVAVAVLYALPVFREYTMQLHIMFLGASCLVDALVWLLCSIDENGRVARRDVAVVLALLALGLGCTRAKFYGEAVVMAYFLLIYRPGMLRTFKVKHLATVLLLVAAVVAVGWGKFSYYFLTGETETFDPAVAESYARPVLYATGALILVSEFPLGSGLASFASYASEANYSQLYHEYGISGVYGLSEDYSAFVCDAFYPSLAQFGVVGVALFVAFMVWAFAPARRLVRSAPEHYRYHYAVAATAMCFVLIESVASTLLMQTWGLLAMMVMAMSYSQCAANND